MCDPTCPDELVWVVLLGLVLVASLSSFVLVGAGGFVYWAREHRVPASRLVRIGMILATLVLLIAIVWVVVDVIWVTPETSPPYWPW